MSYRDHRSQSRGTQVSGKFALRWGVEGANVSATVTIVGVIINIIIIIQALNLL